MKLPLPFQEHLAKINSSKVLGKPYIVRKIIKSKVRSTWF